MKRPLIPLLFAGLAVGCSGDVPTNSDGLTLDFAVAGNSGCFTPNFNVAVSLVLVPPFNTFTGPVTGDLIGTATAVFSGGDPLTGTTQRNFGTAHWEITGGVMGPLVFDTEFANRNHVIDRPGSPATQAENSGTHRALRGVAKANLTYEGTFDVIALTTDHDYHGVICP